MKSLLIINDQKIRQAAFEQAEKLLKKIDRLELDLELFTLQDQALFTSWYNLTFANERQKISDLHDDYIKLAKFHNWIIAASKMLNIDLPEAFVFLQREENRYAQGSEQIRTQIDSARKKRDEFLQQEIIKESGYFSDLHGVFDDEDFENQTEADDADETDSEQSREGDEVLKFIHSLNDKDLQKVCAEQDGAYEILWDILELAKSSKDRILLIRVWDFVPHPIQLSFARLFTKQTGTSFKKLIKQIRDSIAIEAQLSESMEDQSVKSNSEAPSAGQKRKAALETESLKQIYRKLVRRLHPDLQPSQAELNPWQKQLWSRVQDAHKSQDRPQLEKLLRIVLLRGQSLTELTISEILESQTVLQQEFEQLNKEAKKTKSLPAWKFSSRKDYAPLQRKLKKEILNELDSIEDQVTELRAQHAFLKSMANTAGPSSKGKRPKKKRSKPGRSPRAPSRQSSFL